MGRVSAAKIKAFTILEVVITLALSSIVIVIAYTGYNFVRQYYNQQQKVQKKREEVHLLNYLLNADIFLSEKVYVKEDTLIFYFKDQKRAYQFQDSLLIRRQQAVIDSFAIHIQNYAYFNQKEPVESGLIDQVVIDQVNGEQLEYRKSYPANIRMNEH